MSEGARFPWKLQKMQPAPTVSYNNIRKPLRAPSGKQWFFDKTAKEWSLVDVPKTIVDDVPYVIDADVVVDALAVDENGNPVGEGDSDAATWGTAPYLEHLVQPTDAFEGICLRYKLTPSELRRANNFTGTNLHLAPNPLKIPTVNIKTTNAEATALGGDLAEGLPHALTTEQVIMLLRKECPTLSKSEARAYLELNDWEISEALENAHDDMASEQACQPGLLCS